MISLQADDRLLILAPHPDDGVLGGGGVMREAVELGIPVHLAYLTFGDFNEWSFLVYRKRPVLRPSQVLAMGQVRHQEALSAAALLGIPPQNVHFLGYPDHGTLEIWYRHWGNEPPHRGALTRAHRVPYTNARRPGAPYKGEEILRDLTELLREIHPSKILVSHPADHHPDHRAFYLYLRLALWQLEGELDPEVYPYLIHHPHWPHSKAYDPSAPLAPPPALAGAITWLSHPLPLHRTWLKLQALSEHATQFESSSDYLRRFIRSNELFGDFPLVQLEEDSSTLLKAPAPPDAQGFISEHLFETERRRFIHLEGLALRRQNNRLTVTLEHSGSFGRGAGVSVYVFGFDGDTPFARMPKPHVQLQHDRTFLLDQSERMIGGPIDVRRRQPHRTSLEIPLSVLHHPQTILVEARSYRRRLPLDWMPWRTVSLL
jgi:LmbE family N-acetylglucosaminyl deacetylase